MYRILCYGDSNTWGYISGTDHKRYGEDERWTKLLQKRLGKEFEVIEEGLNGRTLLSDDTRPGKEGRNGYEYLLPCLDTHDPIDLVVIMLGTNELKTMYNKTAEEIAEVFEKYFIHTILERKSQFTEKYPKVLIIAPPVIEDDGSGKYCGSLEKSQRFNELYMGIAKTNNCYFIDNSSLSTGSDKVHLTKESHSVLAELVFRKLMEMF